MKWDHETVININWKAQSHNVLVMESGQRCLTITKWDYSFLGEHIYIEPTHFWGYFMGISWEISPTVYFWICLKIGDTPMHGRFNVRKTSMLLLHQWIYAKKNLQRGRWNGDVSKLGTQASQQVFPVTVGICGVWEWFVCWEPESWNPGNPQLVIFWSKNCYALRTFKNRCYLAIKHEISWHLSRHGGW